MNIYFIIQARTGSTRLPNKIIKPFYNGKSILELLVEKLKSVSNNIIIATSTANMNDVLAELAEQWGVYCYRGSENDVLKRFIDTAEIYQVNHIIRVCSDNPFLELDSINKLIAEVEKSKGLYDYISFNVGGLPSIKTHFGFWTEYVSLKALKKVNELTTESLYHEHVTNYVYAHPELFTIKLLSTPERLLSNNIRLTIDTAEDFNNAQRIYSDLCSVNSYPTIEEILSYMNNHSELYLSMKEQIVKNSK